MQRHGRFSREPEIAPNKRASFPLKDRYSSMPSRKPNFYSGSRASKTVHFKKTRKTGIPEKPLVRKCPKTASSGKMVGFLTEAQSMVCYLPFRGKTPSNKKDLKYHVASLSPLCNLVISVRWPHCQLLDVVQHRGPIFKGSGGPFLNHVRGRQDTKTRSNTPPKPSKLTTDDK